MEGRTVGISRGLLDLRRLVLLREVSRTGTIAGAAEALSYSASAVSQQLSRLQGDLGIRLLDHVGRNVFLTPAAVVLVDRLESVLNQLEDIDAELSTVSGGGHQHLRIGAFQSFTTIYGAALVASVREQDPRLDLSIRQVEPDAAMAELSARRLDFVVVDEFTGVPAPRVAHVHSELVTSEKLIPYYPRGLEAEREADLSELAWVCEPRGTSTYERVVNACREHGFEPRIKFETADFEMQRQLVKTGVAAAFLPELFLRRREAVSQRIEAFAEGLERRIYTVVREGGQHYPAVQLVRRLIAAQFD